MKKIIILLLCFFAITACTPKIPNGSLELSQVSLKKSQRNTKTFNTKDEIKVLNAAAGILQDLGFSIEETERELGLITGSKKRSAVNGGQIATKVVLALFTGSFNSGDLDHVQKIRASLVTYKAGNKVKLRVTFQRLVWRMDGTLSATENITDPQIYTEFFNKLSKSEFFEQNNL